MAQQPERMRTWSFQGGSTERRKKKNYIKYNKNCVYKREGENQRESKVKDKSYEHCGNVFLTLKSLYDEEQSIRKKKVVTTNNHKSFNFLLIVLLLILMKIITLVFFHCFIQQHQLTCILITMTTALVFGCCISCTTRHTLVV